jgi:TonB-dependent starch-binding outer membrane protein SusC
MKLTFLLLFVINLQVFAKGYAQTFTLNLKNVGAEEVFNRLQNQSNYRFFYNSGQIKTLDKVTVVVKDETLPNILNLVLGERFNFKVLEDNVVVISPQSEFFNNIQGTITDEKGVPLSGVSVVIKGTNKGTTTNADGRYVVDANANDILVFSMVGYERQEVPVNKKAAINVQLSLSASSLSQVVVVGYGTTRKRDVTGSVGSVKVSELQKAPVRSFEEALSGRLAGVTAVAADGQPGASINIVVRGNNSLTQDNSPLYVIDGFPVENPDNNAINPAEIESIEVLKDASSTAIYGARGANGVIMITTKKGREGKPIITYDGYYGFQQNNKKMDLMNPYEFVKYQYERDSTNATNVYLTNGNQLDDFKNVTGVDLQDSLFRTSPFHNHFLSLSGGSRDTKYSVSGSILNQDGILTNSGYDRYQGRFRLDQRVNNNLNVGINTNYSYLHQYGTSPALGGNGFFYGNMLYSVWAFRPTSGKINDPVDVDADDADFLVLNGFNPIKTAKNELREKFSDVLTSNAYAEYAFAKFFKLRITGGMTKTKTKSDAFDNSQTPRGSPLTKSGKDNGVSGSELNSQITNWVNENTLSYSRKISNTDQLDLLAGITASGTNLATFGAAANHIPNEDLQISGMDEGQPVSITSTTSAYRLASFLGRANYNLHSKYLFTVSFRADGSSKFAPENKWSYFPSGAIAWRLSDENFMKSVRVISNAKIRASYGSTGNNRVSDFAYLSRISLPSSLGYSYNNQPNDASILTALGNPNLKWETTNQLNFGFDLGLFEQRIALETDLYRKVTSNLLLDAAVPGSIGFSTALKNIGKVQNQGIEFTLNTLNIKTEKFNWNTNFNISFNQNKVLALSDNETERLTTASWDTYTQNVPLYIAEINYPIARFWGYVWDGNYQYSDFDQNTPGVYTLKSAAPSYGTRANIKPGDIKFKDINGPQGKPDGLIDAYDRTVIGNPSPVFTGGFSNNFTYGNFDLNIFFNFSYGNDVININRIKFDGGGPVNQNMYASYINRWTPDNPNNSYFRTGGAGPVDYVYNTRVIEDGSFIKLKTVSLGYNVSSQVLSRFKIRSLRFYASGQNLLTFTHYQGFDPEVNKFGSDALRPAFDYSVYPYARTITFGLNVSF